MENAVEMRELRQKADIVTYQNGVRPFASSAPAHDVDSGVHFSKLEAAREAVAPQFAELRSLDHGFASGRSGECTRAHA